VTLRGSPIVDEAVLPDGRRVTVRVGLVQDPYLRSRDVDTVSLDLTSDEEVLATVNTVLEARQDSEARRLVRRIVSGLESGEIEPTAGAIEPFADSLP
jgi:uncharacterized radical SAM superfamily protein